MRAVREGRFLLDATEEELRDLLFITGALSPYEENQATLLDWLVYWAQGDLDTIIDYPNAAQETNGPATAQRVIRYFLAVLDRGR